MTDRHILKPEPLWYLRSIPYSGYRQSDHWKLRRAEFLEVRLPQCARCGIQTIDEVELEIKYSRDEFGNDVSPRSSRAVDKGVYHQSTFRQPRFDVHHLTYARLGCEADEDLEAICAPCHNLEHFPNSHAARAWVSFLLDQADLESDAREWNIFEQAFREASLHRFFEQCYAISAEDEAEEKVQEERRKAFVDSQIVVAHRAFA